MEPDNVKTFEDGSITIKFKKLVAETHNGSIKIWLVDYNSKEFIIKSIQRSRIETQKELEHCFNERQALQELSHPLLVKFERTLKDEENLYLLMKVSYGVTLDKLLVSNKCLKYETVQFIAAQLILALEYIHSEGFIYRDIKASNIIINCNGKINVIDMGFSKKIEDEKTDSILGTTHAMAPEFFEDPIKEYSYEIDYYSFGILLFELYIGKPPFGYESENKMIIKDIKEGISDKQLEIIDNKSFKSLLKNILEKNPEKRLGNQNGIKDIKKHQFFENIDWKYIEKFINNDSPASKEFSIEFYQDDIEFMGLLPKLNEKDEEISKEDKKKLDSIFN